MNRIALLLTLCVTACDYGVLWKESPYQVQWIDTKENRTLTYDLGNGHSIERVEAEILAVGINERYVVAKQRKMGSETINYFYIERNKDHQYKNDNEITQGPFSINEFIELKKVLGLPDFIKKF